MKKSIVLLLILACTHQAVAMQADGTGTAQSSDESWGFSGYLPDMSRLRSSLASMLPDAPTFETPVTCGPFGTELDVLFHANATARPVANPHATEMALLRDALREKDLQEVFYEAVKEQSPTRFVSLVIGMQALKMEPNSATKELIEHRLNALHLEERKETVALLTVRLTRERHIHNLRKQFVPKQQLSDDENYQDVDKFVDSVVNDNKW